MNKSCLKVKGIFLDLDGTIVDSTEAYVEAAKRAYQAIGLKPPETKTALEIPRRIEQGFSMADLTNGETKEFLKAYYQTWYIVSREKTKLIPNVSATLEVLSQKAKLALITMRHVPKTSNHNTTRMLWHFPVFHPCRYCFRYG